MFRGLGFRGLGVRVLGFRDQDLGFSDHPENGFSPNRLSEL